MITHDYKIEFELIETIIKDALNQLYETDKYLIVNEPNDNDKINHVSERSIMFRLGIYIEDLVRKSMFLKNYNVDAEYNRNILEIKKLPSFPKGTYPDIIIHKRNSNSFNLLILEIKTWWYPDVSSDIKKITEFMDESGDYKYQYGLSVLINKKNPQLHWVYKPSSQKD